MNQAHRILCLAAAVLLAGVLTSCASSEMQLMWAEANLPGRLKAIYGAFSGAEVRSVQVDAGETLVLNYKAKVNRGTLAIHVENADEEVLWEVSLDEDGEGDVEVTVAQEGRCIIVVKGEEVRGNFDLSWRVKAVDGPDL